MKRVLTILAILLLPLSVWAMTPVTDSDLSNVTGQAGVNINADVTMNVTIGTMAWGDTDGLSSASVYNFYGSTGMGGMAGNNWSASASGGEVGVMNFALNNFNLKARTSDTYNGYNALSTSTTNRLKPITIDVGTCGAAGPYAAGVTFVRFGLGSIQITMDSMWLTVGLANKTGFTGTLDQVLGQVYIGGLGVYISPYSYVDIYNATGGVTQGVNITMNVRIDQLTLSVVSWGDGDGLGAGVGNMWFATAAGTTQGWIGLQNITMGVITVAGTMRIDVATTNGGVYGAAGNVTVVRINFANFNIGVAGPITANVNIGDAPAITMGVGNTRQLGDIYLSGLNVQMSGWVDIWAH